MWVGIAVFINLGVGVFINLGVGVFVNASTVGEITGVGVMMLSLFSCVMEHETAENIAKNKALIIQFQLCDQKTKVET